MFVTLEVEFTSRTRYEHTAAHAEVDQERRGHREVGAASTTREVDEDPLAAASDSADACSDLALDAATRDGGAQGRTPDLDALEAAPDQGLA